MISSNFSLYSLCSIRDLNIDAFNRSAILEEHLAILGVNEAIIHELSIKLFLHRRGLFLLSSLICLLLSFHVCLELGRVFFGLGELSLNILILSRSSEAVECLVAVGCWHSDDVSREFGGLDQAKEAQGGEDSLHFYFYYFYIYGSHWYNHCINLNKINF